MKLPGINNRNTSERKIFETLGFTRMVIPENMQEVINSITVDEDKSMKNTQEKIKTLRRRNTIVMH